MRFLHNIGPLFVISCGLGTWMEFQGAQAMGTSKEMFVSRLVGDRDCASMTSSVPTDRHPKSLKIIQPEESEIKSSLPSPSVDSKSMNTSDRGSTQIPV
jgi:hypothetical protein